jgi:hypothetical protein
MLTKQQLKIIEMRLRAMGADGLCKRGCGCEFSHLAACGHPFDCVPAKHKHMPDDECNKCKVYGCSLSLDSYEEHKDITKCLVPLKKSKKSKKVLDCTTEWYQYAVTKKFLDEGLDALHELLYGQANLHKFCKDAQHIFILERLRSAKEHLFTLGAFLDLEDGC